MTIHNNMPQTEPQGVKRPRSGSAFSFIEIMVVVALLSLIVLGLMAMFNQTQRAFQLGMSQTDILESGRMATDLVARELRGVTPSLLDRTNSAPNFYEQVVADQMQVLPGTNVFVRRTNVLCDLFFITRQNQTWTGIGYLVRTNRADNPSLPGGVGPVGSLFRFEINNTLAEFEQRPWGMYAAFYDLANFNPNNLSSLLTNNVSKVLDGVVDFKIRPYDLGGWVIPYNPLYFTNSLTNFPALMSTNLIVTNNFSGSGEVGSYYFFSNAVPGSVELELGILEGPIYNRYKSIPVPGVQADFLTNQCGHVHLFRQRLGIRSADPAAYYENGF